MNLDDCNFPAECYLAGVDLPGKDIPGNYILSFSCYLKYAVFPPVKTVLP